MCSARVYAAAPVLESAAPIEGLTWPVMEVALALVTCLRR